MASSPTEFGQEVNHGFDARNYERRERGAAVVDCDKCGKEVLLIDDTHQWIEGDDGRWHHEGYGPAEGVCCGQLYIDCSEGCFRYDLSVGRPDGSLLP